MALSNVEVALVGPCAHQLFVDAQWLQSDAGSSHSEVGVWTWAVCRNALVIGKAGWKTVGSGFRKTFGKDENDLIFTLPVNDS